MAEIIFKPDSGAPSIIIAGTIRTNQSVRAFSTRTPSYFPPTGDLIADIKDAVFLSSRARKLSALNASSQTPPTSENEPPAPNTPSEIISHPFLGAYAKANSCISSETSDAIVADSGIDTLTISFAALELNKSQMVLKTERGFQEDTLDLIE